MVRNHRSRTPRDDMVRTRVYLWRHPEVVGSYEGKFWGHTDVALTRAGESQRKAMAKYMAAIKLTAVYSSDLQRARLTAEAIARAQKPRQKVNAWPEFRELNLGAWEGLTYADIDKRWPGALEQRMEDLAGYRIEGGESLEDLAARVIPAFRRMVEENPTGSNICLVGHAGVNRVILSRLLGAPLEYIFRLDQQYAALNLIEFFPDGLPLVCRINQPVVEAAAGRD